MRDSAGRGHILVWMHDAALARRVRQMLKARGFATTWAAALPDAIAAVDRDFPVAVACTLQGRTPSFIDLETLHAYQALGHRVLALSPTPIWALAVNPAIHAPEIDALRMPVHLLPFDLGPEALIDEMMRSLCAGGPAAAARRGSGPEGLVRHEIPEALLVLENAAEAAYLARYLLTRGLPARAAQNAAEAQARLCDAPVGVLVLEDGATTAWRALALQCHGRPILLVASDSARMARISPLAMPHAVAGTLSKPIRAQLLEACLRRLLRISPPQVAATGIPAEALAQA